MAALASKVQNIPQHFKSGIYNVSKKFNEFDKKLEKVVCEAFKELKELFSNVISETYAFLKNHKLSCFTYISAILCGYFNVGNPAHVIALFAITVVHETISYFKSPDYRFKCTTKKFIQSIENLQKHCRNKEVATNDLEFGKASAQVKQLISDLYTGYKMAKNGEQAKKWESYPDNRYF
ncbi:MAG: hypothetical protein KR126chlam6_00352, partial [Candidatus Anoxychlamydiales bacterium]|nr:hypothetical protein [Candidatus Anoxychlamydiales bacterium]